jgi:hypothetical protein
MCVFRKYVILFLRHIVIANTILIARKAVQPVIYRGYLFHDMLRHIRERNVVLHLGNRYV